MQHTHTQINWEPRTGIAYLLHIVHVHVCTLGQQHILNNTKEWAYNLQGHACRDMRWVYIYMYMYCTESEQRIQQKCKLLPLASMRARDKRVYRTDRQPGKLGG